MNKNEVNFELNLLPVISLLAVCISFLLLTAIWVNVGTLDIRQAVGEQAEKEKDAPTLWVEVSSKGGVIMTVKNLKTKFRNIKGSAEDIKSEELAALMTKAKEDHPELETAMVIPSQGTAYQHLIKVFESLKAAEIKDIGVSPI